MGALGTCIDLASLYVFVEYVHIPLVPATILSFLLAVANNYLINKTWTFKNKSKNNRKLFVKFLIVSIGGLLLTLLCMHVLVRILGIWYMFSKAITSLAVLTWNFLANKLWTFRLKERIIELPSHFTYDLSIIIPAYNEENRIRNTLLSISDFLTQKKINAEILVVDDGSSDTTRHVVAKFQERDARVKMITSSKNFGKGHSVKKGVEASRGKLILFTDADNSTPIEEYEKLLKRMHETQSQIAIGSRYLHDSDIKIKQPFLRILIGRMGNLLIRLFLIDGIKDTQCGFKLFEHKVAREIFSFQKVHRFAFDMEALVIADNMGYKIVEVPVSWFNSTESRVRPIKDALRSLKDLLFIKLNLWCGRYSSD